MTTELWRVADVAQRLKVSTLTVWRLVKRGTLPVVAIGRSRRFRPEDVERLVQANTLRRPARPAENAQKRPVETREGFGPTCEPSEEENPRRESRSDTRVPLDTTRGRHGGA